jgi:hypothetical protein
MRTLQTPAPVEQDMPADTLPTGRDLTAPEKFLLLLRTLSISPDPAPAPVTLMDCPGGCGRQIRDNPPYLCPFCDEHRIGAVAYQQSRPYNEWQGNGRYRH